MGQAILAGLLSSGIDASQISASTKSAATAERLTDECGIEVFAHETNSDANGRAVDLADIVIVAVKPAYVVEVLTDISGNLRADALVISVAAGITTQSMEAAVAETVAVIRSMPNTPAIVGRAVTGLANGSRASEHQMSLAQHLFETIGTVLVVDESKIDALSTVSGSGPAYVFFFIEQFTKAAIDMGFSPSDARLLVEQTFAGASELLAASGKEPADLRRQVTSPNGTTMRAVAVFEEANLHKLFADATAAALARAKEIAAGN
jgi:pyrroline-5-carboxylate reductase